MPYQQVIDRCFRETIDGAGVGRGDYQAALKAAEPGLATLRRWHADGTLPLLQLPAARADLAALQPLVQDWRQRFRAIVVLGIGGSSLGGQALAALADQGFGPPAGTPKVHFLENLDPHGTAAALAALPLEATGFIAISKSGSTAETLAQTLVFLAALHGKVGDAAIAGRFVAITEASDNPLRRLAGRWGFPVLEHDPKIGGRYSVLSIVGMLPALLLGLDAAAIRAGAGQVLQQCLGAKSAADAAPAVGAALGVALARGSAVHASVLMPYADRLERLAFWYRQLWAESLGKQGHGTVPIRALGPVDQHSQLQLYLDGPNDKFFTLILPRDAGRGPQIDTGLAGGDAALDYLHGRTIGDLALAEGRATAETLAKRGRPTRVIELERIDERSLGALLMHFMLETVLAAHLLGVDPFDQPAVEEGKILARRYLAMA